MTKISGDTFEGLSFMFSVDTKAQLLSATCKFLSSVKGDPIAHRPRPGELGRAVDVVERRIPGGRNFMFQILSYIFSADFCALASSQFLCWLKIHLFCILYVPSLGQVLRTCHGLYHLQPSPHNQTRFHFLHLV